MHSHASRRKLRRRRQHMPRSTRPLGHRDHRLVLDKQQLTNPSTSLTRGKNRLQRAHLLPVRLGIPNPPKITHNQLAHDQILVPADHPIAHSPLTIASTMLPMPTIHPTAIIDPRADIADDATVGPYCVLTGPVTLHPGVNLIAQCHINGPVTIGARTRVYPFAAIGFEPQDYKFGPDSVTAGVTIGEDCLIREYASVHAASNDHTPTSIGDRVFMMTSSHAGHDCRVGNDVVMVSGALLGGHVTIGDKALLGGGCLVHQHCRVGRLAMMGGGVPISADLPPYMTANAGNRIGSPNLVGMKRNGFSKHDIDTVKSIVSDLIRTHLPKSELMAELERLAEHSAAATDIRDFIAAGSRPICAGMNKQSRGM